jgi:hypothetical protein
LAAVTIGDYEGFINKKGEYVIPLQFTWASSFYDGLACVEMNDKYGFIDKKGEWVIQPQFDDASDFCCGYVAVKLNDKWGFIDKKGEWVVQPIFNEALFFIGDLAMVFYDEDDDGFSYVNTDGQIVWKNTNSKNKSTVLKSAKRNTNEQKSEFRRQLRDWYGY